MPVFAPLLLACLLQDPDPSAFEAPAFGDVALPTVTAENAAAWREYLRPTEEEAAFEAIPWRPTFAEGLREAGRAERPLLLWVMNGHPLGCT